MSERFVVSNLRKMETGIYQSFTVKARGVKGTLNLLGGDPDFETPKHIREAATKAIEEGWTHYPQTSGMPDLKEALVNYHKRYGTDWDLNDEVIATSGGTPALFMSMIGTLKRGDEVVLFEPYYMDYSDLRHYLGLKLITVPLKEDKRFHPEMEELHNKITPKTKMIVLCSQNNPTGTVFSEEELSEIAKAAKENDLLVLSDEIYDQFIYDGLKHHSIAAFLGMRERTIVILSFSKTFAMTGWRLGSIMADKSIIGALRKIPLRDRPATFLQKAGVAALNGPWGFVEEFRQEFNKRRDHLVKRLNEIEGVECVSPEGAFYLFPNLKTIGQKSIEFCEGLLQEHKVAVVPGVACGDAGEYHIRIPLVKPIKDLDKCADAMEIYAKKHSS